MIGPKWKKEGFGQFNFPSYAVKLMRFLSVWRSKLIKYLNVYVDLIELDQLINNKYKIWICVLV